MAMMLSGGGITSKVDVTYLNFFLKEFNAVSESRRELNPWDAVLGISVDGNIEGMISCCCCCFTSSNTLHYSTLVTLVSLLHYGLVGRWIGG